MYWRPGGLSKKVPGNSSWKAPTSRKPISACDLAAQSVSWRHAFPLRHGRLRDHHGDHTQENHCGRRPADRHRRDRRVVGQATEAHVVGSASWSSERLENPPPSPPPQGGGESNAFPPRGRGKQKASPTG